MKFTFSSLMNLSNYKTFKNKLRVYKLVFSDQICFAHSAFFSLCRLSLIKCINSSRAKACARSKINCWNSINSFTPKNTLWLYVSMKFHSKHIKISTKKISGFFQGSSLKCCGLKISIMKLFSFLNKKIFHYCYNHHRILSFLFLTLLSEEKV